MGAAFKNPNFAEQNFNGTGYSVIETQKPLTYSRVTNNTGNFTENNKILSKVPTPTNNIAIPYLKLFDWNKKIISSEQVPSPNYDRTFDPFLNRFLKTNQENVSCFTEDVLLASLKNLQPDFFIAELGLQDYLSFALCGGEKISLQHLGLSNDFLPDRILDKVTSTVKKGVIINVPDILDFPFFQIYNYDDFPEAKVNLIDEYSIPLKKGDIILPTKNVNEHYTQRRDGIGIILKDEDVLTSNMIEMIEMSSVKEYNYKLALSAKKYNVPVVDLYNLFKKVRNNTFISDDGFEIYSDFITGNFFSSDGIHPSEIGQAVITNELIKTVNSFYGTKIPLINITEYAKHISR